jgi:hypothetical protein
MKKLIFILSFLIFHFVFASPLEITEIMYNPEGNDSGREWIEVKNISNQTITITSGKSGWRINDGSNHLFEENLTINPGEIFVIIQDRNLFLKDYPNFSGKSILANFSLKNESGQIQIFDQNKNLVTSMSYQSSCGGNGNGYSIIFRNGQCFENKIKGGTPGREEILLEENKQESQNKQEIKNNQSAVNLETTSTEVQALATKTTSSIDNQEIVSQLLNKNNQDQTSGFKEIQATLIISEFLPNPEGDDKGKEFVEIYNYGDQEINLENFILKIGDKNVKLNGEIKANEYLLVTNKDHNFYIRNKGETLALYYFDKKIFEINYNGQAPEGKSFARNEEGEWLFTRPTPGKENIFDLEVNNIKTEEKSKEEKISATSTIQNMFFAETSKNLNLNEEKSKIVYPLFGLLIVLILSFLVWLKL